MTSGACLDGGIRIIRPIWKMFLLINSGGTFKISSFLEVGFASWYQHLEIYMIHLMLTNLFQYHRVNIKLKIWNRYSIFLLLLSIFIIFLKNKKLKVLKCKIIIDNWLFIQISVALMMKFRKISKLKTISKKKEEERKVMRADLLKASVKKEPTV